MSNYDRTQLVKCCKERLRLTESGRNVPREYQIWHMALHYTTTEEHIKEILEELTPPKRAEDPQPTYD